MAKPNPLSHVRIIGGEHRRRLVPFIAAAGLRPTPDRLRETLFNWLTNDLPNATVLDCCAGSGVLGFEAISRGAKSVTMIEPNLAQYRQLQATATTLHIPPHKLTLINGTAQESLPTLDTAFDIILLDPPYDLDIWQVLLHLLHQQSCLHTNSRIYIEANQPLDSLINEITWLEPLKNTKVGQIFAGLYRFKLD